MKKIDRNILKRGFLVVFGLFLIGIGASLFLYSKMGADPNGVFIEGVSKRLNISYGISSIVCNALISNIIFFVDRSYIHFSTLVALFVPGLTADFMVKFYKDVLYLDNNLLILKIFYLIISGVILCIGIAIYTNQNLGIAAFDAMSEIIAEKKKIKFSLVRRGMDFFMLGLGFLLGGLVGFGTVYLGLTTGPLITLVRNIMGHQKELIEVNNEI